MQVSHWESKDGRVIKLYSFLIVNSFLSSIYSKEEKVEDVAGASADVGGASADVGGAGVGVAIAGIT